MSQNFFESNITNNFSETVETLREELEHLKSVQNAEVKRLQTQTRELGELREELSKRAEQVDELNKTIGVLAEDSDEETVWDRLHTEELELQEDLLQLNTTLFSRILNIEGQVADLQNLVTRLHQASNATQVISAKRKKTR